MTDNPILRRAFLFLEEGNWEQANIYIENVLNQEPENGLAYLGKLMIECQAHTKEELMDLAQPFDTLLNYQRCIRYSDAELVEELHGYVQYIKERNQIVSLASAYNEAVNAMNSATTETDFKVAAEKFRLLNGYDDSYKKIQDCLEKAEEMRRNELFYQADRVFREAGDSPDRYRNAAKQYESLEEYFDLTDRIAECYRRAEECEQEEKLAEEAREKRNARIKHFLKIVIPTIIICVAAFFGWKWSYREYFRFKPIEQAKVGDYVKFGTYRGQVITWKVIEVGVNSDKDSKLLIAEQCVDAQPYNIEDKEVSWEECSLRKWLNNDFYNSAFSKDEQVKIALINSGKCDESISLLTNDDATKYFTSSADRVGKPSVYAVTQNIWVDKDTENCPYWLRTNNTTDFSADSVNKHGNILHGGFKVTGTGCGVRPVIVVNTTLEVSLHRKYEQGENKRIAEEQKRIAEEQRLAKQKKIEEEIAEEKRKIEEKKQQEIEAVEAAKVLKQIEAQQNKILDLNGQIRLIDSVLKRRQVMSKMPKNGGKVNPFSPKIYSPGMFNLAEAMYGYGQMSDNDLIEIRNGLSKEIVDIQSSLKKYNLVDLRKKASRL